MVIENAIISSCGIPVFQNLSQIHKRYTAVRVVLRLLSWEVKQVHVKMSHEVCELSVNARA